MKLKTIAAVITTLAIGFTAPAIAADAVTVGVTTTGVPFTFIDTATSKPTGAMVELAEAIAAETGMTAEFEVVAFSALIPSLTTGKIDMISAGMFATDKRREVVDFSTPVYSYGEGMFVAADDATDYTLDDLNGATVGAQVGTTFADTLKARGTFGEIKLYDSIADIMRDVKLGRIKAGFGDKPIIAYQISQNPKMGVRLVEGYQPMKPGDVALAVSKENTALLDAVNAAIAKLKDSGALAKIFAKYGL
ncbi:amino acid ABC transporter substrate-binding protein [Tistrella bauzanensis]|uniref:Amino acid ABC transporter substrate-binding protein n=1 Tax=Tistrella bauzanensis TaxID=657419 RepID=A0ABQ1J6X5_9PROT|nr:ABC transporter substrate-binding protein [Tistrella bauzanensis]GGB61568.1 amino acid ABC transporter substrate-binding protein [Tistrella bauzanensis]